MIILKQWTGLRALYYIIPSYICLQKLGDEKQRIANFNYIVFIVTLLFLCDIHFSIFSIP